MFTFIMALCFNLDCDEICASLDTQLSTGQELKQGMGKLEKSNL